MASNVIQKQAEVCGEIVALRAKYAPVREEPPVAAEAIIGSLRQFQECVRYLNTRRSTGAILTLESEANVQDALYLMLRPWVHDLVPENPTDRIANRFTIKDLISPSAETVIEAKYVRNEDHGKRISEEMHDDIENYRHHPKCSTLIFFVYDPNFLIPDESALRRQIECPRNYGTKSLRCVLIVKP